MKALLPYVAYLLLQYGAFAPPTLASEDTLAVIVNPSTRASSLSADQLEAFFSLSQREWSGGQAAIPFNYAPGTPLREAFDRVVMRMKPDQAARFWIDHRIRGLGDSPRKVPTVALMLRVVAKLPGSIGYVPSNMLTPDVKVVAIIEGGKVLPPPSRAPAPAAAASPKPGAEP